MIARISETLLLSTMAIFAFGAAVASAAISPNEVLLVANANSSDSLPLAQYYAAARQIPNDRLLTLALPTTEEMSRAGYDANVAKPIRQFLTQRHLADRIKLIVCVYGVPLKIAAAPVDAQRRPLAQTLSQQFRETFRKLTDLHQRMLILAGLPTTGPSATIAGVTGQPIDFTQQRSRIEPALAQLAARIEKRMATLPEEQKQTLAGQFGQTVLELRGLSALPQQALAPESLQQAIACQKYVAEQSLIDPTRRTDLVKYYQSTQTLGGVLGLLQALYGDISQLEYRLSSSALDDELSLVLYDDVPLAGRLPNALNPHLAAHPICQKWPKVIMTGRIDGPSPYVVRRMIDDALAAETSGLVGNAAIDARGITDKNSGYAPYDIDLRTLAAALNSSSKLPTTLDDREPLFSPNANRNVAIYCGWYSVKRYVRTCEFTRGAVAWHIASFEAMTLRKPSPVWCPNLLADGAAATLGPTDEPFLDSFPRPNEFFGVLLAGDRTLVECYFQTKKYTSWRMTLVGDPLYRPFAINPQWPAPVFDNSPLPLTLMP